MGVFSGWSREQRNVVVASFLGWSLDAFDFFLLVFMLKDIAADFSVDKEEVALAITLTLAMRPIGAYVFGRLADRFGRRPVLMIDVLLYSVIGFASAFAPNLLVLLVLRALFGIAMGGEWGIGASLTMETIPEKSRGFVSGLLQSGYPTGYFIASAVYGVLFPLVGWRGVFMASAVPALLVLFIRRNVPESPSWKPSTAREHGTLAVLKAHWPRVLFAVALMTAFNFLSHGTQDLYPTFLRVQHDLDPHTVSLVAMIYNVGAIVGGIAAGTLSQRVGRRRMIVVMALLVLPVLPLWAFSGNIVTLAIGAFLVQVMVQGAWGVVPAHLNELSPQGARATFPGVVYQLGNFLASSNAVIQAHVAKAHGDNYGFALAAVAGAAAVAVALFTAFGPEAKGVSFEEPTPAP
jgi:SHS family lactate transporter-like MFS transporter